MLSHKNNHMINDVDVIFTPAKVETQYLYF